MIVLYKATQAFILFYNPDMFLFDVSPAAQYSLPLCLVHSHVAAPHYYSRILESNNIKINTLPQSSGFLFRAAGGRVQKIETSAEGGSKPNFFLSLFKF